MFGNHCPGQRAKTSEALRDISEQKGKKNKKRELNNKEKTTIKFHRRRRRLETRSQIIMGKLKGKNRERDVKNNI